MKTIRFLSNALIALTITNIGLGNLSAAEPFYEGLGSYSRKITTKVA